MIININIFTNARRKKYCISIIRLSCDNCCASGCWAVWSFTTKKLRKKPVAVRVSSLEYKRKIKLASRMNERNGLVEKFSGRRTLPIRL